MRKPIAVARLMREPGRHAVGNNVYLQVTSERARSWVFRFEKNGKGYHLGLGSCSVVTLAGRARKGSRSASSWLPASIRSNTAGGNNSKPPSPRPSR
jgi:hypothetical protein